ncbi:MAG TPA: CbiX/SirB N-terminal domain-containing protein, partial [Longimicrobiaceae bacterium]|nr:CbiX/SirB N-terminal domain-containing protein [Longimicrobiaceae bacterium]
EPSLRDALALMESDEVVVVPLFLAEGYFTREVVPRELGLDRPPAGMRVRYCPPVGVHPRMAELILRRAVETCGLSPAEQRDAALIVIGHGTDRNATSGDTVYRLTERLREESGFGAVECGFLDEDPRIEDVLAGVPHRRVVMVPFFVAEGWHSRTTIPRDLGLDGGLNRRDGRQIWYTPAVGTLPELAEVVMELAREAGSGGVAGAPGAGPSTPERARAAFLAWVEGAGEAGRAFLQTCIRPTGAARYELRHVADVGQPRDALAIIDGPDAAQEVGRFDDAGRYRPLRTTADLRRRWVLADLGPDELCTALDRLYPAAVLRWYERRSGTLRVVPFSETAARQTGMYARVGELTGEALAAVVRDCCGPCLRAPVWAGRRGEADGVPCGEACSVLLSRAREALAEEGRTTADP